MNEQIQEFQAWFLIKAASEENGIRTLSGPVVARDTDYDGEILDGSGVMKGLDVHERLGGEVDWGHMFPITHDPKWIIGKSIQRRMVDGIPHMTTALYNKPMSDAVWEHYQAQEQMAKAGVTTDPKFLGYSIYGRAIRNPKDHKHILETHITWVTIDAQPKGYGQTALRQGMIGDLMSVAKSLTAEDSKLWVPAPVTLASFDEMIALRHTNLQKAYTTGGGIVTAGETGAPALREQCLSGAPQTDSFGDVTKRKKRKRRKEDSIAKGVLEVLSAHGVHDPEVAGAISRRLAGKYETIQGR